MRVVPALTITAAMLSSTVIETTPAVYVGGTTYALAALVYVGTIGQALAVYESLQNGNAGHTPASSPTWWKSRGNVYAEYAGGTTYGLGDTVQVAATHMVYSSLIAGNAGNAVTDATKWFPVGKTNKWAEFDLTSDAQTTVPTTMTRVITPGVRVNSLYLGRMVANQAVISVTSVLGGGTVFSETVDLNTRSTTRAYEYCFGTFSTREKLIRFNLPPYVDAVITVTLNATTGNVSCGAFAIGNYEYIGAAQYGADADDLNFSEINRDFAGNIATMTQRRTVPQNSFKLKVDKIKLDRIRAAKKLLNGIPAVWSGLDDDTDGYFDALLNAGFYRRFSINAELPTQAEISLEIEGF